MLLILNLLLLLIIVCLIASSGMEGNKRPGIELLPYRVNFNNQTYIPAKCRQESSTKIKKIGTNGEGIDIFSSNNLNNGGILLKLNDKWYQCYTLQP